MGKQIQPHMFPQDCTGLIRFVQDHDPVVVIPYDSDSPQVVEVHTPCERAGVFCLWNQGLLPLLEYRHIPKSDHGPYFRVDSRLPVLEFIKSVQVEWNGHPALLQGRIYSPFECPKGQREKLEKWYSSLILWIRRHWVKNPVPLLGGYVGPTAFAAYRGGVTLLPMFAPPLTPQWISWSAAQDSLRSLPHCRGQEWPRI